MIAESGKTPEESLPEMLVARARRASDGRLAVDVATGFVAALAAMLWHPRGWVLVLALAVCLAAFGAWGIIDRELRERRERPVASGPQVMRALTIGRALAALAGAVAFVVVLFAALGVALGTWIS